MVGVTDDTMLVPGTGSTTVEAIIHRRRYDTATAAPLADDEYVDGSNRLQLGRATHLYRGPGGAYFAYHESLWQGERDRIVPLSDGDAEVAYADLPYHQVPFEAAFPGVEVVDA